MADALDACGVAGCLTPHGHGVGLEVRDYPIVVPANGLRIRDDCIDEPADLPLEENMVLALEVSQYLPGIGSLHHERTFVVSGDGGRQLVAYEREAPIQTVIGSISASSPGRERASDSSQGGAQRRS
jgi:Xaa-Pro aminopeptidase